MSVAASVVKNNLTPKSFASAVKLSSDTSLLISKNTYSSVLGEPAIVTAPLSAVTSKSFAVPLCDFPVVATAVPNAVFKLPLSASAVPASVQTTSPVFVEFAVKNA